MKEFLININRSKEFEEKFLVLIIYDITDNKRRYHFCKYISSYATRVQKSCFETYIGEKLFAEMLSKIDRYINEDEDNIRVYRLSANGKVYNYGIDTGEYIEDVVII